LFTEPPQILPIPIPIPPPDATVISIGQPMETPVSLGTDVVIYCPTSGIDTPSIVWFKNGTMISTGGRFTISTVMIPGTAVTSVLSINGFQSGDVGTYSCRAINIAGTATGETTLEQRWCY